MYGRSRQVHTRAKEYKELRLTNGYLGTLLLPENQANTSNVSDRMRVGISVDLRDKEIPGRLDIFL